MASAGEVRAPFSNVPAVHVTPDHVFYSSGQSYRVSRLDTTFHRTLELRWPGIEKPLESADVAETRDVLLNRNPAAASLVNVMLSAELLPQNRPAIGRLIVDERGQIWVSRFEPAPALHESEWYVHDSKGRPLSRVELPPGARLAAVFRDCVALVESDEFDVHTVVVYQIMHGTPSAMDRPDRAR